ncbi:MAG: Ig domain-containing protein, partial [Clostridia bacterium]|nr:Ig domain-containing protein [Clostridia bacterium]
MKKLFLRQISLILVLAMLLSLTGVAEDGMIIDEIGASDAAVDEMAAPDIAIEPEGIDGVDLSVDPSLTIGEVTTAPEAPATEAPASEDDNAVKLKSVPKALTLGVKETYNLGVKKATYSSSRKAVATVSKAGVITAKKKGTATIKVMSGKKVLASCKVTVVAAPKKVSLGMKSATMGLKETLTLVPVIAKKSHTSFTFIVNNKKIATVSAKGVVKARKVGSTTVTVKTHNGKTDSIKVTVKKAPKKVTVKPKTLSLEVGQTAKLAAKLPNKTASFAMTWTSGNKKVATVDENGVVTAVGAGKTKITVNTFNKKKGVCTVTVTKPQPTQAPTETPTQAPTIAPTTAPTTAPTQAPPIAPTTAPTQAPTTAPTQAPTT